MLIKYLLLSVQMQMGAHFEAQTECMSCWLSGDQGINYCMKLNEIIQHILSSTPTCR